MRAAAGNKRFAASRRQLLMVGVLALIFAVVLFIQFGPDEPVADSASPDERAPSRHSVRQTGSNAVQGPGPNRTDRPGAPAPLRRPAGPARPWPVVSLQEAVRYDPFATPGEFIARAAVAEEQQQSRTRTATQRAQQQAQADADARRQQALETLRTVGVSAIVSDGRDHVALIGSQMVRVGDVLEGFRVVAIGPDGVMLGEPEGGLVPAEDSRSDDGPDAKAGPDSQAGPDPAQNAQPPDAPQSVDHPAGEGVSPQPINTQEVDDRAPRPDSAGHQL